MKTLKKSGKFWKFHIIISYAHSQAPYADVFRGGVPLVATPSLDGQHTDIQATSKVPNNDLVVVMTVF